MLLCSEDFRGDWKNRILNDERKFQNLECLFKKAHSKCVCMEHHSWRETHVSL